MIEWTKKKPTAEWSNCKQNQEDVSDNFLNESRMDITWQHNEDCQWPPPATLLSEILFVSSITEY